MSSDSNEEIQVFPEEDKVLFLPSPQRNKKKMKCYNDGCGYVDRGLVTGGLLQAWLCDQPKCIARIHVNRQNYVVRRINTHTHTRDPTLLKRAQVSHYFLSYR